jgi:hypothetical protein
MTLVSLGMAYRSFREVLAGLTPASIRRLQSNVVTQIPACSHRRQQWVIPPKANRAFVAAMEDVLAIYTRARRS